jgi:hypothetical protein
VQMHHCTFDETDCYKIRSVPVIYTVSSNQGSGSGGQELTLTGYGFDVGELAVTIDGFECQVTASAIDSLTCLTGVGSAPNKDYYHDTHGIR